MRSFQIKVKDTALDIELRHVAENPKISAIEVYADPSIEAVDPVTTTKDIPVTTTTIAVITTLPPVVTVAPKAVYRINCGGSVYVDSNGNTWSGDDFFTGGDIFGVDTPVLGTKDSTLFQTERYGLPEEGLITYALTLPNGKYTVRLYLAEIFVFNDFAGLRAFNVAVEGKSVLTAYDIVADVGFNTAVIQEFKTTVADGDLSVVFSYVNDATKDGPKIGAIEVLTA